MLPSGMESLTDPCLSDDWNAYSAYAGLFAMLAILAMQLIEFIAHHQLHRIPIKDNGIKTEEGVPRSSLPSGEHDVEVGHSHGVSLLQESENHKVSTYLLEFGVALHSVLIGVALGTTDGSSFVALFIALCFHQFFEAIALGAQIERLANKSLVPAIVMIIFFALTTPVGIAIGIGIHSGTYNPKSLAALMVNGVLDSVSAGILIYIALVNLMAGEMGVHAHAFFLLKKRLKFLYFAALYLGAAAMAVIGRWA
jgi:zinc transporter 1/2/3